MKFVANGVKYETEKLTFVEGRAVEKATGRTMEDIEKPGGRDLMAVQAFVWVAMKRLDPTLTFTDLDDMPIEDIEWGTEEEIPPADGADPTPLDAEPGGDSTPTG